MKNLFGQLFVLILLMPGCDQQPNNSSKNPIESNEQEMPAQMESIMELHPNYPIVDGRYQMTEEWSIELPSQFNRRIEDGSMVIWKPGFTIWIAVWGNENDQSKQEQLDSIRSNVSTEAFDHITEDTDGILRHAYQLNEEADDDRQSAFYGFVVSDEGYVQIAIYFDNADGLKQAKAIWRSIS